MGCRLGFGRLLGLRLRLRLGPTESAAIGVLVLAVLPVVGLGLFLGRHLRGTARDGRREGAARRRRRTRARCGGRVRRREFVDAETSQQSSWQKSKIKNLHTLVLRTASSKTGKKSQRHGSTQPVHQLLLVPSITCCYAVSTRMKRNCTPLVPCPAVESLLPCCNRLAMAQRFFCDALVELGWQERGAHAGDNRQTDPNPGLKYLPQCRSSMLAPGVSIFSFGSHTTLQSPDGFFAIG